MEIKWAPTQKQKQAWDFLHDNRTREILFGGGAGGGKTTLGAVWILSWAIRYPGTRYLIGRAHLKHLKSSSLLTFFSVCKDWGLKQDQHYTYNSVDGVIKFWNGSEIYLKDLQEMPSDPEYDRLGSFEGTAAWIDEGSEIRKKAYQITISRLRYKIDEFNLQPKILVTSNPSKDFLYYDFYVPSQKNELPKTKVFVQALAKDNPYLPKSYIENMKTLDKNTQQRLLFGNWDYDDDPSRLMEYSSLSNLFTNFAKPSKQKWLICDPARYGPDNAVIAYWNGYACEEMLAFPKSSLTFLRDRLLSWEQKFRIQRTHIIIDDDGVGGGLTEMLPNSTPFNGGAKPIGTAANPLMQYANLKAQCAFKLADLVNQGELSMRKTIKGEYKQKTIEDLEQIKQKNFLYDTRKRDIIPKKEVKDILGRSPDWGDTFIMRMLPEIKPTSKIAFAGWDDSPQQQAINSETIVNLPNLQDLQILEKIDTK